MKKQLARRGSASIVLLGVLLICRITAADLHLVAPVSYAVFQRSSRDEADVPIAGQCDEAAAVVEASAQLMTPYRENVDGRSTEFVAVTRPNAREFRATLKVPAGGWYVVSIRARDSNGKVIGEARVEKVGVGEVFVAAGHSFCSNYNADAPTASADDRVATCADWTDERRVPPKPLAFRHCEDPLLPGDAPRASPWPFTGDALVARLHMPVMILCTGVGGTTVQSWRKSAEDPKSPERGYHAFRTMLKEVTPYTGLRAVIWFGNENDLWAGPTAEVFAGNLRKVIEQSRIDSSDPNLPWVIAYDAYFPDVAAKLGAAEKQRRKERIDRGVEIVLQSVPQTFDGPQTDDLGAEFRRADGDHFNEEGLKQLAPRFARKIVDAFWPAKAPEPMAPGTKQ